MSLVLSRKELFRSAFKLKLPIFAEHKELKLNLLIKLISEFAAAVLAGEAVIAVVLAVGEVAVVTLAVVVRVLLLEAAIAVFPAVGVGLYIVE